MRRLLHVSSETLKKQLENLVDIKYIRSSGPGGQNVNKVSTCAEARVNIYSLYFLKPEAIERLKQNERKRVNKNDELVIQAQEHRTQIQNRETVISKILTIIVQAMREPKRNKNGNQLLKKEKRGGKV